MTFSNQPITLLSLVPTWILLIACPPISQNVSCECYENTKNNKNKRRNEAVFLFSFLAVICDARDSTEIHFLLLLLSSRQEHSRIHTHTHNHIKTHLLLSPLRDILLTFAFSNNLAPKTWRCTKDGLISSLLFSWRRSSFVITAKNKHFFFVVFGLAVKQKMNEERKTVEGISTAPIMGDLPAYSCYAGMTCRPTMMNRHRSYRRSHHILVDWSSSLPLRNRLLRIRRMKIGNDRVQNRNKNE